MIDPGAIFGRSMAFPPRLDGERRIAWSTAADNIRESIRIILSTEPGERVMLPEFGAGLKRFLFEPNTVPTHRMMEEKISQALALWEPRIRVEDIDISVDTEDARACRVTIRYSLVVNQQSDQLQFRVQLAS
ncbi:MAG TPA: GPW/gp25 family protein [Gammaproteobacteria bacterium]